MEAKNQAISSKRTTITRTEISNLSPSELLIELARRGIKQPALPAMLKAKTVCPHCDTEGQVEKDFGVRVLRGEVKPQSWCRECRANPKNAKAKKHTAKLARKH